MAIRQVVSPFKIAKCHCVESGDDAGSCIYEAVTAYEAGEMVVYNNTCYMAITDIPDTDTDTPLDAPDRWALVLMFT